MPDETPERRRVPRTVLATRPAARMRGLREVRLLDLSPTGAQIEHLDLLRPRAACILELPLPSRALPLPAQVVWCAVVGRRHTFEGASRLVAHSGLRFAPLTAAQHGALADSLPYLAAARPPTLDSQQRSA